MNLCITTTLNANHTKLTQNYSTLKNRIAPIVNFTRFLLIIFFFVNAPQQVFAQAQVTDPALNDPNYALNKQNLAAANQNGNRLKKPQATGVNSGNFRQNVQSAQGNASGNAASILNANGTCFIPRDASYTAIPRNDDGSYGPVALPFNFNLYGTTYSELWINTNGNVTFTSPFDSYSPDGFPLYDVPMVAAFWGDVDTRSNASGQVYYKVSPTNIIITYDGVGSYEYQPTYLNTFQIVLTNGLDPVLGIGNNVGFNYDSMNWAFGSAFTGAATVGINEGPGLGYVQVGRFMYNNASYDGPGNADDGIYYLNNNCSAFNVSAAGNIPPSFSNLPAPTDTIFLNCGQTFTLNPQFIGPEVNQQVITSVNTNGMCGVTTLVSNGNVSNANLVITASPCNAGVNTITFTATDDDLISPQTTTVSVVVKVQNCCNVSAAIATAKAICGNPVGNITVTPANGVAPYQYSLDGGNTYQASNIFSGLAVGTYPVKVKDANGCETESEMISIVSDDTTAPVAKAKNVWTFLINGIATINATDLNNGSSDACGISSLVADKTTFNCSQLGSNAVTLTVTDNSGNVSTATATVFVIGQLIPTSIVAIPTSSVNTGGNPNKIYLGYGPQNVRLQAIGGVSFSWSPAAGLSNPTAHNPIFTPTAPGTYTFTVTSTSLFGCVNTASITITVEDVRCGNKNDKVLVCHQGQLHCYSANNVANHLAHGDKLASCGSNVRVAASGPGDSNGEKVLLNAYPNPFRTGTKLEFILAKTGSYKVELLNKDGILIRTIADEYGMAGKKCVYEISGEKLQAGVYVVRFISEDQVQHERLILER